MASAVVYVQQRRALVAMPDRLAERELVDDSYLGEEIESHAAGEWSISYLELFRRSAASTIEQRPRSIAREGGAS